MPMKKTVSAGLAAALMLILILDGQSSLQSASDGLALCLQTVIPSLFPFIFLCAVITSSMWGAPIPLLHGISGLLGIPEGGESLLVAAFLGGYPSGAQVIGSCFQKGRLSRQDAQRLLPLCNNAGPAFLFGMTALQFPEFETTAALWLIQILSVFYVGILSANSCRSAVSMSRDSTALSNLMNRSVRAMAGICGWVILFQILNNFLERWILWHFSTEAQVLLKGLLELSSGSCELRRISSAQLRFLICTIQMSFGGLCIMMQTASVIGDLSLTHYLRGKLIQTGAAAVLSVLYLRFGWFFLIFAGAVVLFFSIHRENNYGFSMACDV